MVCFTLVFAWGLFLHGSRKLIVFVGEGVFLFVQSSFAWELYGEFASHECAWWWFCHCMFLLFAKVCMEVKVVLAWESPSRGFCVEIRVPRFAMGFAPWAWELCMKGFCFIFCMSTETRGCLGLEAWELCMKVVACLCKFGNGVLSSREYPCLCFCLPVWF